MMTLIPYFVLIVAIPLSLYFFCLYRLNSCNVPRILTGAKDDLLIAFALSGLLAIGPGQLCIPIRSLIDKGLAAWFMIFFLYLLNIFLCSSLLMRPRIILYNITREKLDELFAKLSSQNESSQNESSQNGMVVNRFGNSVDLPDMGIHLFIEESIFFRNISLMAAGHQSYKNGWKKLEELLAKEVGNVTMERNGIAAGFLLGSLLLGAVVVGTIVCCQDAIIQGILLSF